MVLMMLIDKDIVEIADQVMDPIRDQPARFKNYSALFVQLHTNARNLFNEEIDWIYHSGKVPEWFTENKEEYAQKAKEALDKWVSAHVLKGDEDNDTTRYDTWNDTFYVMGTEEHPIIVNAKAHSTIYAFENATIIADDSKVLLYDNSKCDCIHSEVRSYDNSYVYARECDVIASGKSTVQAHGSWINAMERSTIQAYGSSYVEANGYSKVFANDLTIVSAQHYSDINASGQSLVRSVTLGPVVANGNSSVVVMNKNDDVTLFDQSAAIMRPCAISAFFMEGDVATFKTADSKEE